MRKEFLVFGAPAVGAEEIAEVIDSLHSGWLGTGPKVARFEHEFATYKDVPEKSASAVNSCTAALHLSLIAAGLQPGDEVIAPTLTFCATINAIIHAGATPVLVDVDPVTMNMDPRQVAARITHRTRAILPVQRPAQPEPDTRHALHLYTLLIDEAQAGLSRDAFLDAMTARNIGVGVHYLSIPEHPFYQERFGWRPEDYPCAMRIGRQTVSLPFSARLTVEDVTDVIEAVRMLLVPYG